MSSIFWKAKSVVNKLFFNLH